MMKIWIVDAFAQGPYSGNPAGVMIVEVFPSDKVCQQIASELNLSETAFIKPLGKDHFHLRWFTPKVEVQLCGHATLAAAHVLHEQKKVESDTIIFKSLSGPLCVRGKADALTLDFPLQKTGKEHPLEIDQALFPGFINCVKAFDDVIIEIESEKELREFVPDFGEIAKINCRGLIVTAKAATPYDFVSRFFAPKVGVNEDPVTGSSHCKLADYWQKRLDKVVFQAYQASARGGELTVAIHGERVYLKGQAITVMEGVWNIPIPLNMLSKAS